jgi:hypothetical protein
MNRKEIYDKIKELNLQSVVKTTYGVNYTNCSSEQLLKLINTTKKSKNVSKEVKQVKECSSLNKFKTLVNILKERHLLLQSDVEKIMNA